MRGRRAYAIWGVALLSAGLLTSTTPALAAATAAPISDAAVQLTAIGDVPWNLFAAIVNSPYQLFAAPYPIADNVDGYLDYSLGPDAPPGTQGVVEYPGMVYMPATSNGALNEFIDSMNYMGNWWLADPTNVLGIDPGDPPKIQGLVDMLYAMFPAAGKEAGYDVSHVMAAELPMDPECSVLSLGGCPDPLPILSHMFTVTTPQFLAGYTFDEPWQQHVAIPIPESLPPGWPPGTPVPMPPGPVVPWANTTFVLDPQAANDEIWAYLTGPQAELHFPTFMEVVGTLGRIGPMLFDSFNPFVQGTYCFACLPFTPNGLTYLDHLIDNLFGGGGAATGAPFDEPVSSVDTPGLELPEVPAAVLPDLSDTAM